MPTYLNLVAPTYTCSTPHTAAMNPGSNTVDLRAKVTIPDWTTGYYGLLSSWGIGNQYLVNVDNNVSKTAWQHAGGNANPQSTTTIGFPANTTKWVRGLINPAAGTCDFYTSDDGASWTPLGAQVTGLSTNPIVVPGSPDPLTAGHQSDGTQWTGRLHRHVLLINGVTISDMDWTDRPVGTHDTTYVASTGETWTTTGNATVFEVESVRPRQQSVPFTRGAGGGGKI